MLIEVPLSGSRVAVSVEAIEQTIAALLKVKRSGKERTAIDGEDARL